MILKMDHIGIVVNNLEEAVNMYKNAYGLEASMIETYDSVKARIAFIPLSEILIELIEPAEPGNGPIAEFLERTGGGFHHVALQVDDIVKTIQTFQAMNIRLLDDTPREGSHDSKIAFVDPSFTQNVLTELVEKK